MVSIRGHGNWCGPGWTAGQWKDAADLTEEDRNVPAIDQLDELCKRHDIELHDHPEDADAINARFIEGARKEGFKGRTFAELVSWFGPQAGESFANLLWHPQEQSGIQSRFDPERCTRLGYPMMEP